MCIVCEIPLETKRGRAFQCYLLLDQLYDWHAFLPPMTSSVSLLLVSQLLGLRLLLQCLEILLGEAFIEG